MVKLLKKILSPNLILIIAAAVALVFNTTEIIAQSAGGLDLDIGSFTSPEGISQSIGLLLSLSVISLVPFILVSTTSFLRFVIVLSLIRMALGTQQSPPNMVMISLAMFLTVFVMTPTFNQIYQEGIKPYQQQQITQTEMFERAVKPMRRFMLNFAREKDIILFLEFSKVPYTTNFEEIPIFVIIPAFIISELKTAFQVAFLIFIPFIVIDLIISNVLLSLGMFMLSPAMISLPFKLLLFVLTDGWNLITQGLLISFQLQ